MTEQERPKTLAEAEGRIDDCWRRLGSIERGLGLLAGGLCEIELVAMGGYARTLRREVRDCYHTLAGLPVPDPSAEVPK